MIPNGIGLAEQSELPFSSMRDYVQAYRQRITTPVKVANRVLEAIGEAEGITPPLNAFTAVLGDEFLHEAKLSTERNSKGRTAGELDGIVIAVKDELDLAGRPTTVGSHFPDLELPADDSTVVKRLRAAGALIVGKTVMHEIGLGVTGLNVRHGTPRNPYAPDRYTGGSSSGSASVVAAGLCPAAVGADGGGFHPNSSGVLRRVRFKTHLRTHQRVRRLSFMLGAWHISGQSLQTLLIWPPSMK